MSHIHGDPQCFITHLCRLVIDWNVHFFSKKKCLIEIISDACQFWCYFYQIVMFYWCVCHFCWNSLIIINFHTYNCGAKKLQFFVRWWKFLNFPKNGDLQLQISKRFPTRLSDSPNFRQRLVVCLFIFKWEVFVFLLFLSSRMPFPYLFKELLTSVLWNAT